MKILVLRKYFLLLTLCFLTTEVIATGATFFDYDGDGKADIAVVRSEVNNPNFVWYILQSRDGFRADVWGLDLWQDYPIFGRDFDGDGKADLCVTRGSANRPYLNWFILNSRDNTLTTVQWVANGIPVPQDYDGDGKPDIANYDLGWWYIRQSSDGQVYSEHFGTSNDRPLSGGDYDGDGKADLAVVRYMPHQPGEAIPFTLYIRRSFDGTWASYDLGDARFTGVLTGDYDGDGKADVAIWQGNLWLWVRSSDNELDGFRFGTVTADLPMPGDYDGDGKTDPAVYRSGTIISPQSYFYVQQSRDGFTATPWGVYGDFVDPGTRYIRAEGF